MRKLLLIAVLLSIHTALSAGIFSWKDASGNTVYGDAPPDSVVAKSVAPPKLTILENFANRYEDQGLSQRRSQSKSSASKEKSGQSALPREVKQPYKSVAIIAPKADQSIRANDGDVSVALSTSPKLRNGDKVVIYLNGNEHSVGKSRVANLSNLDRGEYQLSVGIRDAEGRSLITSEEISFTVLKNSVLTNKIKPYNPYEVDPSQ